MSKAGSMGRRATRAWQVCALGMVALLAGVLGGGCGKAGVEAPPRDAREPWRIVATVGMVADIVAAVGGDRVQVTTLIGAGVDPHLYKPTRNDVAALMRAELIFYNGLLLEGRMTDTLQRVGADKPVIAVAAGVGAEFLLSDPATPEHHDPHVWMDPSAWVAAVGVVRDALQAADPDHAAAFAARAAQMVEALQALDVYARGCMATIPESSRMLVTAHDAFRYFGRAYGLEVRGIQGLSTESEAGLEDLRRTVSLLVERRIAAVFVETSVPDKNVRALIEGATAQGHTVRIGGSLYSDAMGSAGTYEGTYVGMIDHNVTTIVRALGGVAPEEGFQGRLGAARPGGGR